MDPGDGRLVALLGDQGTRERRDGGERIVAQLGARHGRDPLVEQGGQRPRDAALGLSALPEQDDVLAGQDRVLELRQDGLVVAQDAGQQRLAARQALDEIGAQLGAHAARPIARLAQLAQGA